MRRAGFDKTTCAPVHIARSAFIYAARRGAQVRETEQGKRPTCAPVEQVFMRLRGPSAQVHGLKRQNPPNRMFFKP